MNFTQYLVIGGSVNIHSGQRFKDLDEAQAYRFRNKVKEVKKGVFECIKPFQLKRGMVIWMDSDNVSKASLQVLKKPEEIKPEEDQEILDELSKSQLIAKFPDLGLDMKMTKSDMLEEIKTAPAKAEPEKEDSGKAKAPK